MIHAEIDASDLLRKAAALPEWGAMRQGIAQAIRTDALAPELAKYPTQSHKKQPFVNASARRYFFAAVKRGQIEVPYRRTGKLGVEWAVTDDPDGLTLTSTRPYSDLVLTKGKQSAYHAGNWPTTDATATKIEGSTAPLIATAYIVELLQKAGLS